MRYGQKSQADGFHPLDRDRHRRALRRSIGRTAWLAGNWEARWEIVRSHRCTRCGASRRRSNRAPWRGRRSSWRRCGWAARRRLSRSHSRRRATRERRGTWQNRCERRRMGASRMVPMAQGRRDRGGRRNRVCDGRIGSGLGRRSARSRHVLVLHRLLSHAGFLGLLPVVIVSNAGWPRPAKSGGRLPPFDRFAAFAVVFTQLSTSSISMVPRAPRRNIAASRRGAIAAAAGLRATSKRKPDLL
jgi:hypothetical protein